MGFNELWLIVLPYIASGGGFLAGAFWRLTSSYWIELIAGEQHWDWTYMRKSVALTLGLVTGGGIAVPQITEGWAPLAQFTTCFGLGYMAMNMKLARDSAVRRKEEGQGG